MSATFGKRAAARIPLVAVRRTASTDAPKTKAPPGFVGRLLGRIPWFTLTVSAILVARFLGELRAATDRMGTYSPGHFTLLAMGASDRIQVLGQGEWWRLFTATTLHGSPDHLIGNLITLLIVGFLLEPMVGIGWFAAIYFTGGFAGAVLSTLLNAPDALSVGASGAIMATLAALFTLSFHAGAPRPNLMRRVAGGSLFPALMPAVAHGGSVTDVNAHLGGCMAGAVLAFIILIAWNDEEDHLPGRSVAATIAGLWVALMTTAFAVSGNTYVQYAKGGMDYIPPEQMPKDVEAMKADSLDLVDKYPKDPRAHMFRGLYLLEQEHVADAEPYFRDAARLGADSPVMNREFSDWNLALLAVTLRFQHREDEARTITAPLCANDALDLRTRQTLSITKLCN